MNDLGDVKLDPFAQSRSVGVEHRRGYKNMSQTRHAIECDFFLIEDFGRLVGAVAFYHS